MSLISFEFLIFTTVLLIIYYICPKAHRWCVLLCGSLIFYASYGLISVPILLASSFITYVGGRLIGKVNSDSKKKWILITSLVLEITLLIVFKFPGNPLSVLGISFFTFMSVSYLTDVYWGVSTPQSSFLKLLLFLMFFPQIVQGPINSYSDMSDRLYEGHDFDKERFLKGLYRIILGLFKKLVIASRLAVYVDRVYGAVDSYSSLALLAATFFYAFQMYCDFSGYMDIALGISEMFGIKMAENFNLPYFSESIPEYWRRWHITLGSWFRSYVYYPIIRSNFSGKIKKKLKSSGHKKVATQLPTIIALSATWLLTGVWHGFALHYLAWGIYHGVIIILSLLLSGFYASVRKILRIKENALWYKLFRIVRTFILVDISYIFFRAESLSDAFRVISGILHLKINLAEIKDALLPFTEDNSSVAYFAVVSLALILLVVSEVIKYVGTCKASSVSATDSPLSDNKDGTRLNYHPYLTAAIMLLFILLFGVFGQSTFIYAKY